MNKQLALIRFHLLTSTGKIFYSGQYTVAMSMSIISIIFQELAAIIIFLLHKNMSFRRPCPVGCYHILRASIGIFIVKWYSLEQKTEYVALSWKYFKHFAKINGLLHYIFPMILYVKLKHAIVLGLVSSHLELDLSSQFDLYYYHLMQVIIPITQ